jgi:hypothetical protein
MATTHAPRNKRDEVPLDFTDFFHSLFTHLKAFGDRERAFLTAKGIQRSATMTGGAITMIVCAVLVTLAFMLGLFAGAKAWGQYLDNEALGYAYTAACLVGAAVLLHFMSGPLRRAIRASVAKGMLAGTDDYDGSTVEDHVLQLRIARDEEEAQVAAHLKALKEPELRGALLRDAVYDALKTSAPFKYVAGFFKNWNR